jgi:signal transduction histidine kinase
VLADVERIGVLLDRLRELARADNPELGGASMLSRVVERLRERYASLQIELPCENRQVIGMSEENALIVFGHLLDNAGRHGARTAIVSARSSEGELQIRVSDDGSGISEGNRERVFDPFFTTRRDEGGTGMGLGIVRALLRAHGGDIALEPSDRGASFLITLPPAHTVHG